MSLQTNPGVALALVVVVSLAGCGGGSATTPDPAPVTPTPAPTVAPPAKFSVPAACQLQAPTVDCATRVVKPQDLAPALQTAIETAMGTPGVMYAEYSNRIYNLDLFRSKVIERLSADNICGAWDYGNVVGDEIYVRSADGCVTEVYDLITGEGGVRPAGKGSNIGQEGWNLPVPAPKPDFARDGDLTCSLPGDRSTFCFSIKNTPGAYGADVYAILADVIRQNPSLFDSGDFMGGQADFMPESLRLPAWRIKDFPAYVAKLEGALRARGYCAYIEKGDILKVKSVAKGNVFHEEYDIVQNPTADNYTGFVIKDRCHNAGF